MSTRKQIKKAAEATAWNPMKTLNAWGVRSSHAYSLGLLSVGVSFLTWVLSRGKGDEKPQSDRWGLFIGEWAPTLFALGVGLKIEEES
ncbi:hypothetical protein [Leucobacter sp. VD1]|uniref:hypothetical protein n=1 Tax=Leucobacter sp. VD1 TaxID=3080381 RepID=UPI0030174C0A